MGNHYDCPGCGQHMSYCRCPKPTPAPPPDFWVMKNGKPVHAKDLQFYEQAFVKDKFKTRQDALDGYPALIDEQIRGLRAKIEELRLKKSEALKLAQRKKVARRT